MHRYKVLNRCRKCGQSEWDGYFTAYCVCWKMRLPKRTKETKQ